MPATCNVVVLLSGTGSNLQALIDSIKAFAPDAEAHPTRISAVISNRADALGLQRARDAGIATRVLEHTGFEGREAFDAAYATVIGKGVAGDSLANVKARIRLFVDEHPQVG